MRAVLLAVAGLLATGCAGKPAATGSPPNAGDRETPPGGFRVGEQVVVRGQLIQATNGLNEILDGLTPDDRQANATPILYLSRDGKAGSKANATCAFAEVPRAAFFAWSARTPAGTFLTVRGTLLDVTREKLTLGSCEIVGDGW